MRSTANETACVFVLMSPAIRLDKLKYQGPVKRRCKPKTPLTGMKHFVGPPATVVDFGSRRTALSMREITAVVYTDGM